MIIGKIRINYSNEIIEYENEKEFLQDIKEFISYMGITAINVTSYSKELGKKIDEIYENEMGY